MHLKHGRASADDLAALAPGVARGTNRIESAARGRQFRSSWQGTLPRRLTGGIHITDDVAVTLPVPNTANGIVGPPLRKTGLLKESTKRFQARTIHVSQETAQARSVRKTAATKQRHERGLERLYALKKINQCPFSTDGIAYEQGKKIDGFIGAEASAYQTDLMSKCLKQAVRRKVLNDDHDFSKPGRD
jgi:hypothetical protein